MTTAEKQKQLIDLYENTRSEINKISESDDQIFTLTIHHVGAEFFSEKAELIGRPGDQHKWEKLSDRLTIISKLLD